MVNIQNPTELYILKRLKELSEEDQLLAEEMVRSLGEWCRVEEVASYLKKSIRSIYQRIANDEIISRHYGNSVIIFTRSLIFILEKRENWKRSK